MSTNSKGFTLIELLVAIVIIGIMTAISLPSFLSWIGKARESEGQQQIATFIKKQTLVQNEKAEFVTTDNWPSKLGMKGVNNSANYRFSLLQIPATEQYTEIISAVATPKKKQLKAVIGVVAVEVNSEGESETVSTMCRAKMPGERALIASDISFSDGLRCVGSTEAIR